MAALDWSQCPAVGEASQGKVSGAWVLQGTRTARDHHLENLKEPG